MPVSRSRREWDLEDEIGNLFWMEPDERMFVHAHLLMGPDWWECVKAEGLSVWRCADGDDLLSVLDARRWVEKERRGARDESRKFYLALVLRELGQWDENYDAEEDDEDAGIETEDG